MVMRIDLHSLGCSRCSHKWIPRKMEVRVCPRCHSPYWDRKHSSSAGPAEKREGRFEAILSEMVRRIVKVCSPEKIILFGSYASGRAGPDSDVDLLIVTEKGESRRKVAMELYRCLRGASLPKDLVVVRPKDFEQYHDVVGTIIYPAVREGRVIYERAA